MSSRQQASRIIPSANRNRLFKLIAATAPLLAILTSAGCDSPAHEADKKVQSDVAKAQAARARGGETGNTDAHKALEGAIGEKEASPLSRAYAKASLAQLEQDSASDAMHRIDQDEL